MIRRIVAPLFSQARSTRLNKALRDGRLKVSATARHQWGAYDPCTCKGPCGQECPCFQNYNFCEKFCACSLLCSIRHVVSQ